MVEHIQGAGNIDFQRRSDVLRFFFLLGQQEVVQILQYRHILRPGVIQVIMVDQPYTTVDDGFLDRLQALLAAHDQLAQRQNEVGFQRQRAFIVRVVQV